MARLCVNVDHVATVRQARMIDYPDPLEAALIAESAGAAGITVHLREDRRHIQDSDVFKIKKSVETRLNLEMAPVDEIIRVAHKVRPFQVMFVPERRLEITTEGGLDVTRRRKKLIKTIEGFQKRKILVSLFIDPDPMMIRASADLGADIVELNTGAYSEAKTKKDINRELGKIKKGISLVNDLDITANAGHGLNLNNVTPIAAIPNIKELHIGHGIISRAITVGMKKAVAEMIYAMKKAQNGA